MSDQWTPVDDVAQDDKGNFMALSGGKWVPVTEGAVSDDGKFMAYGLTFKQASPYITPEVTMRAPAPGPRLPIDQQRPQQGTSYRATDMSPLLRQGAAIRSNMVSEDPGVMDPRYPAWKRAQEQGDQLGMAVDVASAALPLVGPAARGAAALARPATSRLAALRDTLSGVPAQAGAEGLRGDIYGELNRVRGQAAETAAQRQRELEALKRPTSSPESAALTDIAGAQSSVRGKLQTKATSYGDLAQKQLDALAPQPLAAEDVGKFIQDKGAANLEKAKAATVQTAIRDIKDPAFAKARARAETGDTPSTNPASKPILDEAVADIEQQIADTPAEFAQGLQKRARAILGGERPMTEAEQRAENLRASVEGREPVSTVREPVTLQQLEFLRRWAKDPALREQTGFGALDATRMARTSQTIERAMNAYEPAVGQYIEAYRKGKQGEGAIVGGGRGERATDKAMETDAGAIFSQKPQLVASTYLDGTQTSAESLLALVGGDKAEVAPMVRAYLRGQIEGKTPAEVLKVISKNNGLLQVFPDAKPLLLSYARAGNESERLARLATKEGGRLRETSAAATKARDANRTEIGAQQKLAAGDVRKATERTAKYANDITVLDTLPAEKVASHAQSVTERMLRDGVIDDARYRQLNGKIADIEKQFGQTQKARNAIRLTLLGVGAGVVGAGTIQTGRHLLPAL